MPGVWMGAAPACGEPDDADAVGTASAIARVTAELTAAAAGLNSMRCPPVPGFGPDPGRPAPERRAGISFGVVAAKRLDLPQPARNEPAECFPEHTKHSLRER